VRRLIPALAATALLGLAGCGGDDEDKDEKAKGRTTPAGATTGATTATAATPARDPRPSCQKASQPKPKRGQKVPKPTLTLDRNKTWLAEVETSCGNFTIQLDVKRAPRTTASFVHLARRGFYDGLAVHRISPGFVVQAGDPLGNGQGGPGYSVTETPPEGLEYKRGSVAMAKTELEDPGTSGSQFFVVTGEDAQLPSDYALLGTVSRGQNVVDAIGAVDIDPQTERPISPVVIRKVRVVERGSRER
jgi:peptidyl-prolyl cis-trans isomerase B (cyclophilin B)